MKLEDLKTWRGWRRVPATPSPSSLDWKWNFWSCALWWGDALAMNMIGGWLLSQESGSHPPCWVWDSSIAFYKQNKFTKGWGYTFTSSLHFGLDLVGFAHESGWSGRAGLSPFWLGEELKDGIRKWILEAEKWDEFSFKPYQTSSASYCVRGNILLWQEM